MKALPENAFAAAPHNAAPLSAAPPPGCEARLCLAGELIRFQGLRPWFGLALIHRPEAVPRAKPISFHSDAGEASLAAHQAAEPYGNYFWGRAYEY